MPSKAKIFCVPPDAVGSAWLACGAWLLHGLNEAGNVPVLDTIDACRDGRNQLWIMGDLERSECLGAAVTQITVDGEARFVDVIVLAGKDLRLWARPLAEALAAFAKAEGARSVRANGRKEWSRLFPEVRAIGAAGEKTVFERVV